MRLAQVSAASSAASIDNDADEDSGDEYDITDEEIDRILAESDRQEALKAGEPLSGVTMFTKKNYLPFFE